MSSRSFAFVLSLSLALSLSGPAAAAVTDAQVVAEIKKITNQLFKIHD